MPEYDLGGNHAQRGQYAGIRGQLRWNRQKINNPLCTTSSKHRLVGHALKWKCHRKGGTHLLWRRRRDGLRRSLRWGAVQSKWVRPAGFFHFILCPYKLKKL